MNQGQNLILAATTGPPSMGSGTSLGNGGAVPPTAALPLAEAGFAVMTGPGELTQIAEPLKKPDLLVPLLGDFNMELQMAREERRAREGEWIVFTANLAGRNIRTNVPETSYTTSKAFLRKSNELHQRASGDLIRMMSPVGDFPINVEVWDEDSVDQEASASLMSRVIRQFKGMDYGKIVRKVAPHLCQYGIAYIDGPSLPPPSEMIWKATPEGRMLVSDKREDQCWYHVINPMWVFPDPTGEKVQDAAWFHIHWPMKPHEMEQWAATLPNRTNVDRMLQRPPYLVTTDTDSKAGSKTAQLNRYEVWRRVGFLTQKQFDQLKGQGFLGKVDKHNPGACFDIYYSPQDNSILHAEIRNTRPNKLPIIPIPMMEIDGEFWPFGMQDVFAAIQDAINRAFRALEDQSVDLSGVNIIVDPSRVQNSNYSVEGRKTWIERTNPLAPEESARPPVSSFAIPNNIPTLIQLMQYYIGLIPEITGLPSYAFQPAAILGSGIRTEGQQTQLVESAASFIRHVMGGLDENMLERMGEGTVDFIGRQDRGLPELVGKVKVIPTGMSGAMEREINGKKMLDAFGTLQQIGMLDWINKRSIPAQVVAMSGLYGKDIIHTPESFLEAKRAEIAEMVAKQNAQNAAGEPTHDVRERARSSVRDTLATAFKAMMDQPAGEANPVAPLLCKELMESCGKGSNAFYEGLHVWLVRNAKIATTNGWATPEQLIAMMTMPGPDSPSELEAGASPDAAMPTQDATRDPSNGVKAGAEEIQQVRELLAQAQDTEANAITAGAMEQAAPMMGVQP